MKNQLLFTVILLLAGIFTASAQPEKGRFYINGLNLAGVQIGTQNDSYTFLGETSTSKADFTAFSIGPSLNASTPSMGLSSMPSINYFFSNKLSGGIFMSTNFISSKEDEDKSSFTLFFGGPSLRCYLAENKKLIPFMEGKYGIGSYKFENDENTDLSGWYAGTGATWFFTKHAGLDVTLGYGDMVAKSGADFKVTSSFFNLGLGILISF